MIPLKIQAIKTKFFDSRMLNAADRARWRFLTYAGGFIRKTARNSMKEGKAGAISQPGSPPFYHRNSPVRFKDTIFYFVEKSENKVYAGAILLNGRGGHKVPKLLEEGGPSTITRGGRQIPVMIRARPHMRPALETFIEKKQAELLKNSITAR